MISCGDHTSTSSQSSSSPVATDLRRRYSSHGGSISTTSNFVPSIVRSKVRRSTRLYVDGAARSAIRLSLAAMSSLSRGYSSKRCCTSESRMKFAGRSPVSTKCWQKSFFARCSRGLLAALTEAAGSPPPPPAASAAAAAHRSARAALHLRVVSEEPRAERRDEEEPPERRGGGGAARSARAKAPLTHTCEGPDGAGQKSGQFVPRAARRRGGASERRRARRPII